jgi:hypothetical protein
MSQNLFPDLTWLNPGGQHQPQTSSYHSMSGVGPAGAMAVDAGTGGGVGAAQPELDLSDFSQVGEALSGERRSCPNAMRAIVQALIFCMKHREHTIR